MAGNLCAFRKCSNSRLKMKGLRMFIFPKDPDTAKIWANNCGNPDLVALSPTSLRKKQLCEQHFRQEDILPSGRLMRGVLPQIYISTDSGEGPSTTTSTSSPTPIVKRSLMSPTATDSGAGPSTATSTSGSSPRVKRSLTSPKTYAVKQSSDFEQPSPTLNMENRSTEVEYDHEGLNTIYIKEEIFTSDDECSSSSSGDQKVETTEYSTDPLQLNEDCTSTSRESNKEQVALDRLAVLTSSCDEQVGETCGESTSSDPLYINIDLSSAPENCKNRRSRTCEFCKKRFSVKSDLKEHIKIHTGEKPFKCEYCDNRFSNKGYYDVHVKKCWSQEIILQSYRRKQATERPSKCESSDDKSCSHEKTLANHIKKNTEQKPFICYICGKSFSRKPHLCGHIRTHTGEKPFKCEYCDKRFSQSNHLISHMRFHTGEKPYKCEFCNECFAHKTSLGSHMNRHTGSYPFKCEFCEKRFSQKGHLNNHIMTHTGEKPYECEHCYKRFSQKYNLITHMRIHTGEKPYKCVHCNKCFSHHSTMIAHRRVHSV